MLKSYILHILYFLIFCSCNLVSKSEITKNFFSSEGGSVKSLVFPYYNSHVYTESVGDYPVMIAKADLNNDGYIDFGVVNRNDETFSIFINQKNRTFKKTQTFSGTGTNATFMAFVNINNDGFKDVIYTSQASGSTSLRLGNGDGTFGVADNFTGDSDSISFGDFNGDNLTDVALRAGTTTNITVHLNSGAGGFLAGVNYDTGQTIGDIGLGDFDGDNDIDLVATQGSNDTIYTFLNNGSGVFSGGSSIAAGNNPTEILVSDFDNDNDVDFAVSNSGSTTFNIFFNDSSGSFSIDAGQSGEINSVIDFDNDGDLDLYKYSVTNDSIALRINDGTGVFTSLGSFKTVEAGADAVLADIDNDNIQDMIYLNIRTNEVHVAAMTSVGVNTFNDKVISTPSTIKVGLADLDGDGLSDIIAPSGAGSTGNIFLNNGNKTFNNSSSPTIVSRTQDIEVLDLNGDSIADYVSIVRITNGIGYAFGNGDGSFQAMTYLGTAAGSGAVLCQADFDQDGDIDLASTDINLGNINLIENDGLGVLSISNTIAAVNLTALECEDLNGDQYPDLVYIYSGGNMAIRLNDGTGGFLGENQYGPGGGSQDIAICDLDNDSDLDIVISHRTAERFNIFENDGNGAVSNSSFINTDFDPEHLDCVDLDKDGNNDVFAYGSETHITVYMGQGDQTFPKKMIFRNNLATSDITLKDLNNDGFLDFVSQDSSLGLGLFFSITN